MATQVICDICGEAIGPDRKRMEFDTLISLDTPHGDAERFRWFAIDRVEPSVETDLHAYCFWASFTMAVYKIQQQVAP